MTSFRTRIEPCGAEASRAEVWRVEDASGRTLRVSEALALLRDDGPFRTFFSEALAASRWPAFFWETPPLTRATLDRELEAVLTDAPRLATVAPDRNAFADRFGAAPEEDVLAFPNLGGDATLVVPCPTGADDGAYAHLAAFVRRAPAAQVDRFWRKLAETTLARVSDAPLWVSTAGLGVSWLHLRLDSRPKYYRHRPYTRAP